MNTTESTMNPSKRILLLVSLFALLTVFGCGHSDPKHIPYDATLVDSQGNGGWMLFDSAPQSYERGRSVALEEAAKVRVTCPLVNGLPSDAKFCPVTVLSGEYAGRSGWVTAAALPAATGTDISARDDQGLTDAEFSKLLDDFRHTLRLKAARSMNAGDPPDACRSFVAEQLSIFQEQTKFTAAQLLQARVCAFNAVWDAVIGFSANSVTDQNHQALKRFEPFCVELQQDPEVQREILFAAALSNDISLIKWLLKQGADVNTKSQAGFTPLVYAIQLGKGPDAAKTVEALLDAGADCNQKYYLGMTATMYAAVAGRTDILKLLLARNADINATNDAGQTALLMAEAANQAEAAAWLKDAGAKE